jgi:hypothetical protein
MTVRAARKAILVGVGLVAAFARPGLADEGPPRTFAIDDPYDLPRAPRPPTLPELTHRDVEGTLESTIGVLTPAVSGANVVTYVQRIGVEVPVASRRWFAGGSYEFAAGEPPGGGATKAVGGNLELNGRTVWATRTGLAFGGGFGLTIPTASFTRCPGSIGCPISGPPGDAARIADAASTLRPWDLPMFQEGFMTLRPFFDVRDVDGPFVIQFREGVDVAFDTTNLPTFRIAAISAVYVGYSLPLVGLGIEAFEYYFLDWPVADDKRALGVVSPSVRFLTPYVQPAISFMTSIGTPFGGETERFWGLRLAVTVVWDKDARALGKDREAAPELTPPFGAPR